MRQLTIRPMLTLAALPIAAVAIAGCGSNNDNNTTTSSNSAPKTQTTTPATNPAPTGGGSTLQVSGKEFSFSLSAKSEAKPGKVTFNFKNAGSIEHDFSINGKTTPLIGPGSSAKLPVTFTKKGTYNYLCTVPGHAAAGMKGTFTVQ